jgi:hypothetical protein
MWWVSPLFDRSACLFRFDLFDDGCYWMLFSKLLDKSFLRHIPATNFHTAYISYKIYKTFIQDNKYTDKSNIQSKVFQKLIQDNTVLLK